MAVGISSAADGLLAKTRRYRRLRTLNIVVGLLLAAETAYMLAASNNLALPVTASFLTGDPVAVRGATLPEVVFSLRIGPTVAVFLGLAALDHLIVAAPPVRRWYERGLTRRANYARWIEYSVSASIMIVLIGLFVGIRDLAAVVAIFAANTAMILFGLLMERQQQPGRADWSAFWFGSLVGIAPWALIAVYLAQPAQVPGFVYAITVVQFVLFFSFAGNMVLQYRQIGRWRDYVTGEIAYIALSFTAKSLLAWLIFANVLRS
ncbi:MAG TPA: heliorhodopsin HeR [Streptosporangiaceae bacterium]|nr:heliorhodopsin HeR [Streptosporangiaceae bacterium]